MNKIYQSSIKSKNLIMFLVALFIFADILCENFIGIIYEKQSQIHEFAFFFGFMLLQIIFAPIQSGLSDLYGRKRSLIVSLFFSFLSLIFISIFIQSSVYFSLLIFATISKGVIGNTLPISLAAIADTQDKNFRLSFAFSTAAYALAYLLLASVVDLITNKQISYIFILSFVLIIIVCIKLFNYIGDKPEDFSHDEKSRTIAFVTKNEAKLLLKDLKHTPTSKALGAFFLWELSLYSILLSQVDFQINKNAHIAEAMMCGYLFGVIILIFSKKINDSNVIKIGYYTSFFSLIPYFILFRFVENQNLLLMLCYFFHAVGNAFLSPALLSILAKERKAHEQGRIYGLTDSVDTFGYLCAILAIIVFDTLKLEIIYLISFSFLTFAASWVFYRRFQNLNNQEV